MVQYGAVVITYMFKTDCLTANAPCKFGMVVKPEEYSIHSVAKIKNEFCQNYNFIDYFIDTFIPKNHFLEYLSWTNMYCNGNKLLKKTWHINLLDN